MRVAECDKLVRLPPQTGLCSTGISVRATWFDIQGGPCDPSNNELNHVGGIAFLYNVTVSVAKPFCCKGSSVHKSVENEKQTD